jgi:CheY-like chemotaxis protein
MLGKEVIIDFLLNKKVKKMKLEKMLIVDDTLENISAAKEYFSKQNNLEVDYSSSAKDAIEKLKSKNYDYLMTDLEMEENKSGLDVIKEGLKQYTIGVIVTGFNYDGDDKGHGPNTSMRPSEVGSVSGKKDDPKVWEQLHYKYKSYHEEFMKGLINESLDRYKSNVGGSCEIFAELFLNLYK